MFLRETRRVNRDGSVVSYLQLAHNERHPVSGNPVAKVIHSFGRADKVDRAALARLVTSISRFLTPEQAVTAAVGVGELGGGVEVLDSRRLGAAWTLDRLWERLGIGAAIRRVATGRRLDGDVVERVVFALVCAAGVRTRARSWPRPAGWPSGSRSTAARGSLDDAAYAAMDFLLDALGEIAAEVFSSVAHLLNLDLDIVFVDTTSTYWETETVDELAELAQDPGDDETTSPTEAGARAFGHSKDHRADLPQVVIAMAVTRDGVPVRCWTFPGDTADTAIIRTIKDDLGGWGLRRLVWVADRGFASAANRAYLTRGGGHYIHAEKLRHTNTEAAAALGPAGPLPHRLRQPAGQGGRGRTRRRRGRRRRRPHPAVRDLPQPRTGRPRPAGPGEPRRASAAAHRGLRHLDRAPARRTRRQPQDQAGAAPLPAAHPGRAAARRPGRDQARGAPGRQVAAAHLRPHPDPR